MIRGTLFSVKRWLGRLFSGFHWYFGYAAVGLVSELHLCLHVCDEGKESADQRPFGPSCEELPQSEEAAGCSTFTDTRQQPRQDVTSSIDAGFIGEYDAD